MVLPWTLPDPQTGTQNGRFDCDTCFHNLGAPTRSMMHCGLMPRDQWTPEMDREAVPAYFGGQPYNANICPGWLVRQPAVIEASQAYSAYEKGALAIYDPDGMNVVLEAAMALDRSLNLFYAERRAELARKPTP